MLDINLIRSQPDDVRRALQTRMDEVQLEPILALDEQRRELIQRLDVARGERKQQAQAIGQLRAAGAPVEQELEARATALRSEIAADSASLATVEGQLRELLLELPNIPDERVPTGGKEANKVVHVWGEPPAPVAQPLDHVELSERLGLVDYARGTKLAGTGNWIYTGMGAALEWALLDWFCREHHAAGYRFVLPPHLLLEESGIAAGQFPKFYDDVFHVHVRDGEQASFLLPTAETALLNFHRDEVLAEHELPARLFAYTPCYRREGGGYRADERGTVRGHQFNKVELFQFVAAEQAEEALQELIATTQRLVEALGLHYRTSLLASRDASATMALTYDIEVWLPSIGAYKEVSSASWARDYQARRANIRFRRKDRGATEFVHTLNASGLATSRLLPALLEQHQQDDGAVRVPAPLQPWLGVDAITPPGD
jgi:seryl-tRNA synthetase